VDLLPAAASAAYCCIWICCLLLHLNLRPAAAFESAACCCTWICGLLLQNRVGNKIDAATETRRLSNTGGSQILSCLDVTPRGLASISPCSGQLICSQRAELRAGAPEGRRWAALLRSCSCRGGRLSLRTLAAQGGACPQRATLADPPRPRTCRSACTRSGVCAPGKSGMT